jgi:hypothetical protein
MQIWSNCQVLSDQTSDSAAFVKLELIVAGSTQREIESMGFVLREVPGSNLDLETCYPDIRPSMPTLVSLYLSEVSFWGKGTREVPFWCKGTREISLCTWSSILRQRDACRAADTERFDKLRSVTWRLSERAQRRSLRAMPLVLSGAAELLSGWMALAIGCPRTSKLCIRVGSTLASYSRGGGFESLPLNQLFRRISLAFL